MLIKLDKKEKELFQKICELSNCKVYFLTDENNPLIMQAEITNQDGSDLSNKDAWHVGRSLAWGQATELVKSN
jgi:hypothetical protein